MAKKKELDDSEIDALFDFDEMEEDEMITFRCIDCGREDEVPDYVVDDFSFDLGEGEEAETVCPFCNGTMRKARNVPRD